MPKRSPRAGAGWRTERAELNRDQVEAFLDVVKSDSKMWWLIYRLIIEHDCTPGEIVSSPISRGIRLEDLRDDGVVIFSNRPGAKKEGTAWKTSTRPGRVKKSLTLKISRDLLRQLRIYAAERKIIAGPLFDLHPQNVRQKVKGHAEDAKIIPDWPLVSPHVLRKAFEKDKSYLLNLEQFEAKSIRQAEATAQYYMALFCIETDLRRLFSEKMKQTYNDNWWTERIDPKLQEEVQKRRQQEGGELMFPRSDPLEYTYFSEMIELLTKHWEVVASSFNQGAARMRAILFPLNQYRDIIAHNSELREDEKKRFEGLLNYWCGMQML